MVFLKVCLQGKTLFSADIQPEQGKTVHKSKAKAMAIERKR